MEFSIKSGAPESGEKGCVVVGAFEPRKLSAAAAADNLPCSNAPTTTQPFAPHSGEPLFMLNSTVHSALN